MEFEEISQIAFIKNMMEYIDKYQEKKMRCPDCGQKFDNSDHFCRNCGKKLG